MSYPQDPGRPPPPGPQGPWQPPAPGPGGPPPPGWQPPAGPGGYGPPPGQPSGHPGATNSPYPPAPGGRPPGGGGNVGLVLVIACVFLAILVVVAGVGLWLWSGSGGSAGASGEQGADTGGVQAQYQGTWDGDLDQHDSAGNYTSTWSLTVDIEGNTISAEEYGLMGSEDSRCTWEIQNAQASESSLTFSYTVADDPDCADNGDVTLTPTGDGDLAVEVSSMLSSGENISTGTLTHP
ncbi:hypothetical protein GCM10027570_18170 [Streptomonospora sediminis]